jgi:hypothetical protein
LFDIACVPALEEVFCDKFELFDIPDIPGIPAIEPVVCDKFESLDIRNVPDTTILSPSFKPDITG